MVHFIFVCNDKSCFSLPLTKIDVHICHVIMYAMSYPIFLIIFILDSEPSYTDKLLELRCTNSAPLVADLFLYCYKRDFVCVWPIPILINIFAALKESQFYFYLWILFTTKAKLMLSTSWYLDDLSNIDNPYIEGMVNQIYPPELQLNKANTTDTEAPFFYCKWICFF